MDSDHWRPSTICFLQELYINFPKPIETDSPASLQITFILDDSSAHNIPMSHASAQCQCRNWYVLYVARQNLRVRSFHSSEDIQLILFFFHAEIIEINHWKNFNEKIVQVCTIFQYQVPQIYDSQQLIVEGWLWNYKKV